MNIKGGIYVMVFRFYIQSFVSSFPCQPRYLPTSKTFKSLVQSTQVPQTITKYSSLIPYQRKSNHYSLFSTANIKENNVVAEEDVNKPVTTVDTPYKIPKNFVPFPFEYHQELTLRVSSLTNLGVGICRTTEPMTIKHKKFSHKNRKGNKNHDGDDDIEMEEEISTTINNWVIMVPNVIPGELVKLKIYRNYKTYSEADLIEIIEPSNNRVTPVCPLFFKCGGCQYQHMDINTQRQWKQEQVQELLEHVGGFDPSSFPPVLPTLGTEHTYHYRSKITPHYDAPKKQAFISAIGFKEKSSRRLLDIPECFIATHAINEKLTEVREQKQKECREGTLRRPNKGATLLLRDVNSGVVTDNNEYVETTVFTKNNDESSGLTFRFMAGNFFQNNPYMLGHMVEKVVEASINHSSASGKPMTHLIDCYCGSGLFCLSSSKYFHQCVGIEVNAKAVDEASFNAALNGIENCAFVAASAEAIFASEQAVVNQNETLDSEKVYVRDFPRDTTVVVVDPPRKGCSEEFLNQLYEFGPQRVVYMSCDPATQARDAKSIVANGYEIISSQPFDLFPQTRHIESLVVFERK